MNPWKLLDRAQTPGSEEELRLYQRDNEFSITTGHFELMSSRSYASEESLATLACQKITNYPRARVLIGGLGMGYTVRSALNGLGARAQVVVAELVPAVVKWNRGILSDLAGAPLDDDRVTLREADVAQLIQTAKDDYNAILLDVDNAPKDLTRKDNRWLYSFEGLNAAFAALRPQGVLAIWSSSPDLAFVKRARKAGFAVEEARVRGRGGGKGGGHYIVWTAVRS